MRTKFIPQIPASTVMTAKIAAHADIRRMSSFCCTPIRDWFASKALDSRLPSESTASLTRARWSATSPPS